MEASVKYKKFTIALLNKDTFYIKYKSNTILTKADLKLSYRCFLEMAEGQPLKSLIEVGKNTYVDPSVNTCHMAGPNQLLSRAKAIVSDSLAIRIMVSQNLLERNGGHKVKVFRTKSSAIKWLDSLA